MDNKEWTQIKVTADSKHLDALTSVMSMVTNSLMIEDYTDVEKDLDGVYGDLIDEELLKKDRTKSSVSAFLGTDEGIAGHVEYIKDKLSSLGIEAEVELDGVREEDWADSWKQYYKPIKTGKKIVIVPVWETYDKKEGEITVLMDPGMAFGTGTHETTRLCASLLEKYVKARRRGLFCLRHRPRLDKGRQGEHGAERHPQRDLPRIRSSLRRSEGGRRIRRMLCEHRRRHHHPSCAGRGRVPLGRRRADRIGHHYGKTGRDGVRAERGRF